MKVTWKDVATATAFMIVYLTVIFAADAAQQVAL